MDCGEVGELLDAYALGATEKPESEVLERHVADCVRCWEDLEKAQRAAALLALSLPIQEAPPHLEERIIGAARGGLTSSFIEAAKSFLRRQNLATPIAVAGAAAAVLVFAVFTQAEMSDLRSENNALESRLFETGADLEQQRQIDAVLLASDTQKLPIEPASTSSDATGVYNWSPATGIGFIMLQNMPSPGAGRVYQAWFTFDRLPAPAGTCLPSGGFCEFLVYITRVSSRPDGVGISIEPVGGSDKPTGEWVLFGSIER